MPLLRLFSGSRRRLVLAVLLTLPCASVLAATPTAETERNPLTAYFGGNMLIGGAATGDGLGFALGIRPELVFKRWHSAVGFGGYAELLTQRLEHLRLGTGLCLVPKSYVVPSLGGYARRTDDRWQPGLTGGLFLGYHAAAYDERRETSLGGNLGIRLEVSHDLAGEKETMVMAAVQFDAVMITMAWLAIFGVMPIR
jgi:hypothetical protein